MSGQLSPIEAEVYFAITLEVWQTKDMSDEPSLCEYRDLAQVVDRLARLKDASEQREELHDPFVLVWLERELPKLYEERARQEGAVPDESDAAAHTGEVIVACEGLIERAKAYGSLRCTYCGQVPETLDEDGHCPICRHTFLQCTLEAMNVTLAMFTAAAEVALDQVHHDDLVEALAEASPSTSFVDAPLFAEIHERLKADRVPGEVEA
jgi:hypothetical protein